MIKALFFDNDGVLVDTEKYFFKSTQDVLEKSGIELTKEKFIELTLIGNEGAWRLTREKNFSEQKIEKLRVERNLLYAEYIKDRELLISGAKELLLYLSAKYKLGIVTSSKKSHFDLIHSNTGILEYFSFILTREDYSKSKPSPEPYIKAADISGYKKEECLVIEDSERGLIASYEAGIKCIVVPNDLTRNCDFSKAWKVLRELKELKDIL